MKKGTAIILKGGGKMKTIENIIEEYKKGDFEKRVNLFLECRELRSEFIEIDMKERKAKSLNPSYSAFLKVKRGRSVFSPIMRLYTVLKSLL